MSRLRGRATDRGEGNEGMCDTTHRALLVQHARNQCLKLLQIPIHFTNNRYAQKKADEMKAISLQSALDTVEKLEVKLTEFAKKHQSEIQNDPVFRQRYVCLYLGGVHILGVEHGVQHFFNSQLTLRC